MKRMGWGIVALLLILPACGEQPGQDAGVEESDRLMQDTLRANTSTRDDTPARQDMTVILAEWNVRLGEDTVRAGPAQIRVRNSGDYPHGLIVEREGQEQVVEPMDPGQWGTLDIDLRPGTYTLYCPVEDDHGDHSEQGMRAYLHVQPQAATADRPAP